MLLLLLTTLVLPARAETLVAPDEPPELVGTPEELQAYGLAKVDRYVKAREVAEQVLKARPDSYVAHFVLGLAQYYGEGNLPRALWELRTARHLFERRYGPTPSPGAPWRWHSEILVELADLLGDMDRLQEKLEALDAHDRNYQPQLYAERTWPLMKLGRYDEARAMVKKAIATGRTRQRKVALTSLCAIESEAGTREDSYRACRAAAEEVRASRHDGTAEFSNAGEAALGMLKLDEAERDFLESTQRPVTLYGNPWAKLVDLYLREGRIAEAVSAMKQVHTYRRRKPAYVDQLSQAETDQLAALLLLALGRDADALPITGRALDRPDRRGGISSQKEQAEAGTAILDRMARRQAAAQLAEERAVAGTWAKAKLLWQETRLRVEAWTSGRRASVLMASRRRLVATIRPSFSGGADVPVWVGGELVDILGPGIVAQAVALARREETAPAAAPYFDAIDAEVALARGDDRGALDLAWRALRNLPSAEVLLSARVAAIGAAAARRLGETTIELGLLGDVMQKDPTAVRRLGLALPVAVTSDGSAVANRAAAFVRKSPRFRAGGGGFTVAATAGSVCLATGAGAVLACGQAQPRAGEDHDAFARRLVAELHRRAFSPRIDMSQTDVRSLDGSTGVGDARSSDKARDVLDGLQGKKPKPGDKPDLDIELNEGD
ncbi:MAG TPA: tetratricopeptide repeat protein [Polyangia bacterium]